MLPITADAEMEFVASPSASPQDPPHVSDCKATLHDRLEALHEEAALMGWEGQAISYVLMVPFDEMPSKQEWPDEQRPHAAGEDVDD